MRTVEFAGWPQPVSALGFGCASLGSRISRKIGITAIERALAAGVTWFDVAPSYGDGEAETILGEALAGAKVAILTKVGLRAPVANGLAKIIRSAARPIVSALPGLRTLIKPTRSNAIGRVALSAENIRTSVARSLERLKVDRLAVLALHDPSEEDVRSDEVLRALVDIRRQGLAARVGIAGSFANFAAANAADGAVDVAQFAVSDGAAHIAALRQRGVFTVMHSLFALRGVTGSPLRHGFAVNPAGVVLASSFTPEHLKANVEAASEPPQIALGSLRG